MVFVFLCCSLVGLVLVCVVCRCRDGWVFVVLVVVISWWLVIVWCWMCFILVVYVLNVG